MLGIWSVIGMVMIERLKTTDSLGNEYIDEIKSGVQIEWQVNGETFTKKVNDVKNQRIIACVSIAREELIIVYKGFTEFAPPHNAAVHNADGSLRNRIYKPQLISDDYKLFRKALKPGDNDEQEFIQPHINKNGIVTLWIAFNYNKFEIWELNCKEGVLVRNLGVSRL